MHGAHQDTVLQRGETKVQRGQKMGVVRMRHDRVLQCAKMTQGGQTVTLNAASCVGLGVAGVVWKAKGDHVCPREAATGRLCEAGES